LGHQVSGLWRTLAGFLLFVYGCNVRLSRAHVLGHLDQDSFVQLHFVAILYIIGRSPVVVADKIPLVIVDHDTFIEFMKT
jgi:hypothetical protein